MSNTKGLYWWICNVADKVQPTIPHLDFLRAYLPRAAAKLGSAPTTILCNPADRDAILVLSKVFAGLTIETRATIPVNHFWIGGGNGVCQSDHHGG